MHLFCPSQTVISESPLWLKPVALGLILLSFPYLEACAPKGDSENGPTPVLSGPPKTTFPMPPVNRSEALGQMGWILADGQRVTMSSFHGKVLVLDFYATWCLPCRESIPHLVALEKHYATKGLAIVGLNVGGPEDREAVPEFARQFNIHYPLGFPDEALVQLLLSDYDSIPQTFVFDQQGQLVKRYIGYQPSMATELEKTIRVALESVSD
jgi:thiol-disulfide isomerase/thioredoxin